MTRGAAGPTGRSAPLPGWLELLPGLVAAAVFLLWQVAAGGSPQTVWYPGALVLLALLAVVVGAHPRVLAGAPRSAYAAIAFLAALGAWSFLSLTWADVSGDAWEGANRMLLYLVVYALFALWPWRSRQAAALLALFAVGTAAIAVAELLRASGASDPAAFFIDLRFTRPTGYVNSAAAILLMAFWPALFLASRREVAVPVRALSLGAAGAVLTLALLPQSRGSLFAFPVVFILYFVLVPGRVRSALFLAPLAAAAALAGRPALDVYARGLDGELAPALDRARDAVLVAVGLLVLVGALLALADRRVRVSEPFARRLRAVVGTAAVVVALAAGAVALAAVGDPRARAADAWSEFKAGQATEFEGSHLAGGGLGSNRYDYWRVAMAEFRARPLHGMGADNFAAAYVRERDSTEEPRYPHSLPVMIVSQLGAVGAFLFAAFLTAALAAAWRGRSAGASFQRGLRATCVVVFAYWAVHGTVDWFWEIPALGAPAVAFLGLAAGLGRPAPSSSPHRPRSRLGRGLLVAVGGAVALAAAASLALPWLAAREVAAAAASWRADPASAFDRLDRARRLDPLGDRADLVAGAIAMRLDERERARAAFSRALERNALNWYAHLELAVIDALAGRKAAARAHLDEAEALNPREPAIAAVRESLATGEPLAPDSLDRLFLERLEQRTT